jgi:CheY-like chemotaxis protein
MSSTERKGPVLVVDDDPDIREAITDTLEQEGYAAVEAGNGLEALSYLRSNPPPPLILLDWNMAPMNGPEFMQEFAKHPNSHQIAVVLLTADVRAAEKAAAGAYVGYLQKPVKLDAFFQLLDQYCPKTAD